MRKIIYRLIIAFLLVGLGGNFSLAEEKNFEPTEKQKLVGEIIELIDEDCKTEWINPYTVQLTLTPGYYIHLNETEAKESANKKAELIADHGYKITDEIICVKIIDSRLGELAYTCRGNTPS